MSIRIAVQALGFALTPALRRRVERCLCFALDRIEAQVSRLTVRLSDLNGPRGGTALLRGRRAHRRAPVVIEETGANLCVAVDRAAARAGRTVARRLERLRDQRHGPVAPITSEDATEPSL